MWPAILEQNAPPVLRARLLTPLGVTPSEVLAGLSRIVSDNSAQGWLGNTIQRIKAHAHPGS